ncbi:MAG TPA: hypothetical protein VIH99_08240 [Bdellovibrionota bacterium]
MKLIHILRLSAFVLALLTPPSFAHASEVLATNVERKTKKCGDDECSVTCNGDRKPLSCDCDSAGFASFDDNGCKCKNPHGDAKVTAICGIVEKYDRFSNGCSGKDTCKVSCHNDLLPLGCGCSGDSHIDEVRKTETGCKCTLSGKVTSKMDYKVVVACGAKPEEKAEEKPKEEPANAEAPKPAPAPANSQPNGSNDLGKAVSEAAVDIQNLGNELNGNSVVTESSPKGEETSDLGSLGAAATAPTPGATNNSAAPVETTNLGNAIQSYGKAIAGQETRMASIGGSQSMVASTTGAGGAGSNVPGSESSGSGDSYQTGGGIKSAPGGNAGGSDFSSMFGGSGGAATPTAAFLPSGAKEESVLSFTREPSALPSGGSKTPSLFGAATDNLPLHKERESLQPLARDEFLTGAEEGADPSLSLFKRVSRYYKKASKDLAKRK